MKWFWKALSGQHGTNQKLNSRQASEAADRARTSPTLPSSGSARETALATLNKGGAGKGAITDPVALLTVLAQASQVELGIAPFPEQLHAALAMLDGDVIHMATGEGKTLVGALAAIGYALQGRRVHVVTVNNYLAGRDAEWMRPLIERFGLTVEAVTEDLDVGARHRAYSSDIVYAPINEIGFDLLRDELVTDIWQRVQSPAEVAIVDEADSVLVDQALVPLVLAGSVPGQAPTGRITDIVRRLKEGTHYNVDDGRRAVFLNDEGARYVEQALGVNSLYDGIADGEAGRTLVQVNLALHAHALLVRDVHYIVRDGAVTLIDASQGRVAQLQRWPDGIQAAVEVKEGLVVSDGGCILDTITIQALMKRYATVCGMTGTAVEATDQLRQFYDLRVAEIDRHRPLQRVDLSDRIYDSIEHKTRAIVDEIQQRHLAGQPVLVGTQDVVESENLADRLRQHGMTVTVLNAKNDAQEARIIAEAGDVGRVTVSTQMAGRGTDIKLGGADEAQHDAVVERGGLAVIGTSRYKTSRLDNQLRGRAGRQGDPGTSVFFVSLEDELVTAVGDELPNCTAESDGRITAKRVQDYVEHCQRVTEGQLLEIHSQTWKYNKLINDQRGIIKERRERLLSTPLAYEELAERASGRMEQLEASVPHETLVTACREIMLYHLDTCWSEHLALLDDVRESIHLRAIAKETPIDEFHRIAIAEFTTLVNTAVQESVATFETVQIDGAGAHLVKQGLRRPSATWTYMVNDNPLTNSGNSVIGRISASFK